MHLESQLCALGDALGKTFGVDQRAVAGDVDPPEATALGSSIVDRFAIFFVAPQDEHEDVMDGFLAERLLDESDYLATACKSRMSKGNAQLDPAMKGNTLAFVCAVDAHDRDRG